MLTHRSVSQPTLPPPFPNNPKIQLQTALSNQSPFPSQFSILKIQLLKKQIVTKNQHFQKADMNFRICGVKIVFLPHILR